VHDDTVTLRSRPKDAIPVPRTDSVERMPMTEPIDDLPPARLDVVPPAEPVVLPKLRVLRGLRLNVEYPLYEGQNLIGRRDDQPIDIDLQDQEPADRVWVSRQHAVLTVTDGLLTLEDLNSLNGTFVNRHRLYPGHKRTLAVNDVVQIGTIHLKVTP
jgi:hypothetical protein